MSKGRRASEKLKKERARATSRNGIKRKEYASMAGQRGPKQEKKYQQQLAETRAAERSLRKAELKKGERIEELRREGISVVGGTYHISENFEAYLERTLFDRNTYRMRIAPRHEGSFIDSVTGGYGSAEGPFTISYADGDCDIVPNLHFTSIFSRERTAALVEELGEVSELARRVHNAYWDSH